jgi:hypothetical protein
MAYSKAKFKSSGDKTSLFLIIRDGKCIRQMFYYLDVFVAFGYTHFNQPKQFHWYPKLYEDIVQYFPPN